MFLRTQILLKLTSQLYEVFSLEKFPSWSGAERNKAGNFSEMEKIWVEWKLATSEHFLLHKRLTHRLLSGMTARYTSVCERSGQLERNRKVAVKSCRLRSGRYEERSDEEFVSCRT